MEHGDLERPASSSPTGSPLPKSQLILLQALERFYPKRYKQDCSSEQLRYKQNNYSLLRLFIKIIDVFNV